jgi:hypothetical protein
MMTKIKIAVNGFNSGVLAMLIIVTINRGLNPLLFIIACALSVLLTLNSIAKDNVK